MTIAGAAAPRSTTHPGAPEDPADSPVPDLASGPGTAPETDRGRLNAPPFSWLGSDAWPNFPLWADKPS